MPTDKDEFFYYTLIDLKSAVDEWGDEVFSELEKTYPDVYDKLEAYLANKQIQEFMLNQSEVV